jgi:hypothetical protein
MFWDVMPCGACKNRHFLGTYHLHHKGDNNWQARSVSVTSNQSTLRINTCILLVTVMIEAIHSSETLVLTRDTQCNIPEDGILNRIPVLHVSFWFRNTSNF